jgi:hypothetical protein
MNIYIHDTVPTEFVEAGGIRFAYRRFGNPNTGHPPVARHRRHLRRGRPPGDPRPSPVRAVRTYLNG